MHKHIIQFCFVCLLLSTIPVSAGQGTYYESNGKTVWCDDSQQNCYYWDDANRRWVIYYQNGRPYRSQQQQQASRRNRRTTTTNRPVVLRRETYSRAIDRITASALNTFISVINSEVSEAIRDAVD